jgi:hypothetical protein
MAREYITRDTTPQNSGHPKRDKTSDHWRNSILVGPQTAGIPTVHNNDEWYTDGDPIGSDDLMQPRAMEVDNTGGAVAYHKSQRK